MLQARNKQANRACTTSNNKWMDVKHCARHLMAFKLDFINVSVTWSFGWLSSIDYRQLWIFVASSVFLATKTVGWCHQLAPYASTLSSILNRKSTGVIDLSFLLLFLLSSLTLSFFCFTYTDSVDLEVYQVCANHFYTISQKYLKLFDFQLASCVRFFFVCQ